MVGGEHHVADALADVVEVVEGHVRGPASVAQPVYEGRSVGDRTKVRRREPRALHRNPV